MAESMAIESSGSSSQSFTPIKVSEFKQILVDWLTANQGRVAGAYNSGGGWELWLHVELYLAVKTKYPNADIVREASSYKTKSLRADLVLNSRCQGAAMCIIEIKTELMSELYTAFWKRVGLDVDKGEEVKQSVGKTVVALAVAITLKPETWQAVRNEVGEKTKIGNIGCYSTMG